MDMQSILQKWKFSDKCEQCKQCPIYRHPIYKYSKRVHNWPNIADNPVVQDSFIEQSWDGTFAHNKIIMTLCSYFSQKGTRVGPGFFKRNKWNFWFTWSRNMVAFRTPGPGVQKWKWSKSLYGVTKLGLVDATEFCLMFCWSSSRQELDNFTFLDHHCTC